ncbi:MAG: hypothetical protein LBQ68_01920 [Clostridiales bacterium]|nr:hypothetical protein [Clostridiales bacterium]
MVFPFQQESELSDRLIHQRTVCAVDLGINNHAVCSVMLSDGTIAARRRQ